MAKNDGNTKKENKLKKSFIKEFRAELKKVIWPTPKQLVNNTIAVVTIVLLLTAIVFVLDVVFDSMNKYGITRLQSYVVEHYSNDNDSVEENNSQNETTETQEDSENETEESQENNNVTEAQDTTQTSQE